MQFVSCVLESRLDFVSGTIHSDLTGHGCFDLAIQKRVHELPVVVGINLSDGTYLKKCFQPCLCPAYSLILAPYGDIYHCSFDKLRGPRHLKAVKGCLSKHR